MRVMSMGASCGRSVKLKLACSSEICQCVDLQLQFLVHHHDMMPSELIIVPNLVKFYLFFLLTLRCVFRVALF